ncbi:DUF2809 domain-containing protein [Pseudonocardia sp. TRM90224]|uniref:DUF2809 domain-containing protein n=1 Tax=Pseudonocardia sp. TRM90224 TaxID=2812678 RepID=UPI001E55D90C|nr:DUF2809 domain-containing protein [Pseudonocardia sp. TRM90224]
MTAPVARQRRWVLVALAGVIACGLVLQLLREFAIADHVGNVLYAAAVYLAVCLVAPRLRPRTVTAVALAVCVAVELLQLTPAPAALAAAFRPAALLLGSTFAWPDLLGYAAGCLVAGTIDHRLNG